MSTPALAALTWLWLVPSALAGGGEGADPVLPGDGAVPGLVLAGAAERYAPSELFGYMNGGAEMYLELGFERLTVQRYRYQGDEITLERYQMADAFAALGVFWARGGRDADLPAPARTGPRLFEGTAQLLRAGGQVLLAVTFPPGKPGLSDAARALLLRVAGQEKPTAPDASLDLLPSEGRVAGSLRIVRGPRALDGFFSLGEGDVLLLAGKATGISARYRLASGQELAMLVVRYPSPEAASGALQYLVSHLDATLKPLTSSDRVLRFQDSEGKFGEASVEGNRLTVRVGMSDRPSAEPPRSVPDRAHGQKE